MDKATYPQRQCKEAIFSEVANPYPCELVDLHPGPCATFSVTRTVAARDAWEAAHPDWRGEIGNQDTIV
jgi:hypothetical protein